MGVLDLCYDLHNHAILSCKDLSLIKKFGYRKIGMVFDAKSLDPEIFYEMKSVAEKEGIEIFLGAEVHADSLAELKSLAKEAKKCADFVIAHGGDLKINRHALKFVDILAHPERGRKDPGFDYVMAKIAKKNNTAIELNFRSFLAENGLKRIRVIEHFKNNIKLARKYDVKLIVTTGAKSIYEMRSPREISAFFEYLGMGREELLKAMIYNPKEIIERGRERKSKNYIMPGVRVVKWGKKKN